LALIRSLVRGSLIAGSLDRVHRFPVRVAACSVLLQAQIKSHEIVALHPFQLFALASETGRQLPGSLYIGVGWEDLHLQVQGIMP
jgi:hypothetical protein